MRTLLVLVGLAAHAYAQPCDVAVVRAPDDVRELIDQELAREDCAVPLEVRVVPVDQGYYVIAIDRHDRVHERVVPDARSAAVLIASWTADDRPRRVVELSPASAVITAPSTIAPERALLIDQAWRPRTDLTRKSIGVAATGILADGEDPWSGLGIRTDIDLEMLSKHWRVGANASLSHAHTWFYRVRDSGELDALDAEATVYFAHAAQVGRWTTRVQLGGGVVGAYMRGALYDNEDANYAAYEHPNAFGIFPVLNASVALGHMVGDHWAIDTGPMVTWLGEQFDIQMPLPSGPYTTPARGFELRWFAGVRCAL